MPSLNYTGTKIQWIEDGKMKYSFAATSGLADNKKSFQKPTAQCKKDKGPIPEGVYVLQLRYSSPIVAKVANPNTCRLEASKGIQHIPNPKEDTKDCGPYWANWGSNRVRIDAYDTKAQKACRGNRSGFYIHDSTKGFTHGCIEVKHAFFERLYNYVNSSPKQKYMLLTVSYYRTRTTRGNTKIS